MAGAQTMVIGMESAKGKSKKRRRCKSRKTTIDFPEEVIFEILARLPARSVGRLRCISKSWLSLTTSPIFVRAHTEHSRAACQSLAIEQHHFNEGYSLALASSTPDNITLCKLKLPSEYTPGINASCDGLLCLESQISRQRQHRIFNPLTGCSVNLPIKKDSHPRILAFYFKHSTSEYRLLKIAGAPNETNMLVVGKNVKIPVSCRLPAFIIRSYTIELNGSLHWLAWKTKPVRPVYTAPPDVILTFHKEAEIYGLISLPPPEKLRDLGSSLVAIKGNLGLLVTDNYGIDLWIKEEQWVKKDSIYYVDVQHSLVYELCHKITWQPGVASTIGDEVIFMDINVSGNLHYLLRWNLKSGAFFWRKWIAGDLLISTYLICWLFRFSNPCLILNTHFDQSVRKKWFA